MDLFDLLLHTGLVTTAIVAYLIFFRRSSPIPLKGNYRQPGWNYYFRVVLARFAVRRWKSKRPRTSIPDGPLAGAGWESCGVRAVAPDGAALWLAVRRLPARPTLAEALVHVRLPDGTTYKLPQHPDTLVGPWENDSSGWRAGDLKIEVLDEQRLRITYNGLLKRVSDGVVEHVRFNFLWTSASKPWHYPEDWSDELAAQALALEPWRDGDWPSILDAVEGCGWVQWGALQGRLAAAGSSRVVRARGLRERCAPRPGPAPRRAARLTAAARDGTALLLHAASYTDHLTQVYSGCVRFPDYTVHSITGTDLVLADFCEYPDSIPKTYTINVRTKSRSLQLVLRISGEGGSLLSGVPYQQRSQYRTIVADIDGHAGSGILELAYHTSTRGPAVSSGRVSLRWAHEAAVGSVGYCVGLEQAAAACPGYVGGKGASLALLASAQDRLGYKVPPGFCITTKALEKHLKENPQITAAIRELEDANVNYDEKNFREKCNRIVELFSTTEISSEIQDEILSHLTLLRQDAIKQNLGPEVRFAVRSSGIGEDGAALSAAGQNESVLGAASERDVLRAVQRCWGSMFAFNSAYYRRQNGQRCACGGGVAVQALVPARAAGVLFTRHPAAGDPARLLLTANYGLGESVVSGAVEPDTIVVSRGEKLAVADVEVGSKRRRVTAASDAHGVTTEEVPAAQSEVPCVSETEILALASVGVAQEQAWGGPRDIEWALAGDDIYLLQARPITSLERWSEEELLHELDSPVMADDELITFANTGEVLPKALTAISYDLMLKPLSEGMNTVIGAQRKDYDGSIFVSNLRCCLALYNGVYRVPPTKLDLMTRVLELAISGSKIADENILSIAQHKHGSNWWIKLKQILGPVKFLIISKFAMKNAIKIATNLDLNLETENPVTLLESIAEKEELLYKSALNHATTSAASTCSQFIAMAVLAEGANDFSAAQVQEVNSLLSSGGVLSAELPARLAAMARALQRSGRAHEFRAQDPRTALAWLSRNLPLLHADVCRFLDTHGHRAVMEFDYSTKPWLLAPHEMMTVLQAMRVADEEPPHTQKSDDEIIAALKTPKKSSTRKILRWVLPLCHTTVRHREITKAHLCLSIHKIRLALIQLGKLMMKQWYLPDEDLVFHFRLHELRDFLRTRDPGILRRACQRRQYQAAWSALRFAELNTGWVQPLPSRAPRDVTARGGVTARGTVVCDGEVVARAAVIKDFSEVNKLQRGDILITHSTDIGWSPYFPLLSGIVTELGGLISHGAVIAREYGLPCVVGVTGATDLFSTGDTVRLDATRGLLQTLTLAPTHHNQQEDDS